METSPSHTGTENILSSIVQTVASQLGHRELNELELADLITTCRQAVAVHCQDTRLSIQELFESQSRWTPPQLAKQLGVSPDKVLGWIRSGELKAINVASDRKKRPRYVVEVEAWNEFKAIRSARNVRPRIRRLSRRVPGETEFF